MKKFSILLCLLVLMAACASKTAEIAEPSKAAKLDQGILTSFSWESSQWNLRFDLPDGYVMATKEELAALYKESEDSVKQHNIDVSYIKDDAFVMMAASAILIPNVMVTIEELADSEMSWAEYIEANKNAAEALDLANEDYEFIWHDELTTTRIAGEEYTVLKVEFKSQGVTLLTDTAMRRSGSQVLAIMITYVDGMQAAELMDSFSNRLPLAMG